MFIHCLVYLFLGVFLIICQSIGDIAAQVQDSDDETYFTNIPELLCPNADDIEPCVCQLHENNSMTMSCMNIADEQQLHQIFQQYMPTPNFNRLDLDTSHLGKLENSVFGDAMFERVYVTNGTLKSVGSETFLKSTSTLRELYLGYNKLTDFPVETLEQYTALNHFDLTGNPISIFPIIVSKTLLSLGLGFSAYDPIPDQALNGLPNLQAFSAPGNSISYFPLLQSKTLNYLNLSLSTYDAIPDNALNGLPYLEYFGAYDNPISSFPILQSETLKVLDLSLSAYGTIPDNALDGLPNLVGFYAFGSPISSFPILRSETLNYLFLGLAPYETIPKGALYRLPNLELFFSRYTNLTSMATGLFTSLPKLKIIDMAYSGLINLEILQFGVSGNYDVTIDLYGNQIATVEANTFTGVQMVGDMISSIELGNNSLTTFPEDIWRPVVDAGVVLDLRDNNLTCGCDVAWLMLDISHYSSYVFGAKCSDGESLWYHDPTWFIENC